VRNVTAVTGAVLLLLATGAYESAGGEPGRLEAGNTVFVSARLESARKSLGPTVVAKGAYENVGVGVQHSGQPYVTEACTALQVVKYVPNQALLRTRDARGMKHTFAGDWSARLHATEQECKQYVDAHPAARVMENRKLRYELQEP
jgi:hypothetical protein